MIKLIIDSTCDLPETYIAENDIKVLPLKILLEDKEYLDGETIDVDGVYAAMKKYSTYDFSACTGHHIQYLPSVCEKGL